MHNFTTHQDSKESTIMFCRKCGLTFTLDANSYNLRWKYIPFVDVDGDEFEICPMPTCVETAEEIKE